MEKLVTTLVTSLQNYTFIGISQNLRLGNPAYRGQEARVTLYPDGSIMLLELIDIVFQSSQ